MTLEMITDQNGFNKTVMFYEPEPVWLFNVPLCNSHGFNTMVQEMIADCLSEWMLLIIRYQMMVQVTLVYHTLWWKFNSEMELLCMNVNKAK